MGAHGVLAGVVPGGEDLLAEEESPWSVPLLGPHLLGVLLALRNGVHHVVIATAQGGHLGRERERGRGWKDGRREGETYPISCITTFIPDKHLWRNWLARSAVNRKVAGSSPARCEAYIHFLQYSLDHSILTLYIIFFKHRNYIYFLQVL